MNIPLHYGRGHIALSLPDDRVAGIIRPRSADDSAMSGRDVPDEAFGPEAADFAALVRGKTAGVLLADGTRDLPDPALLERLLGLMKAARKILFFICTGTHTADTPENQTLTRRIIETARACGPGDYEIIAHDCRRADFAAYGRTAGGTAVRCNRRVQEPSVFVVVSDVKPHYFAGYSNPVKYFVPGLCAFETVEQNHSWTMHDGARAGAHPWHPDPALRDNPLAADQAEAMAAIVADRPVWALVTLSSGPAVRWAAFGPARPVTAAAFARADAENCFAVKPVRRMIVSPGGLPNDGSLYIAQRTLELTASVVADGGQILFLAACPEGVGSERTRGQFYDKLIEPLETIRAAEQRDYKLFSHKPWRFARLIRRLERLWMHSQIPPGEIEKMHMHPCPDPQSLVDDWLARSPGEPVLVVDGANKLLLRPCR